MNDFLILGSGSSCSLTNYNTNALVINDKGTLLIDCGHTIKHALNAQNMGFESIDAIFITHVHGDHVFGLERVAFETYYSNRQNKIILYFHESIYKQLWDQTLKGSLTCLNKGDITFEDYFDIRLIKDNAFTIFDNHYEIFEVEHVPSVPAFGVNINQDIFYSGDTVAIAETINQLQFRVGFHDTNFNTNPVHASLNSLINSYPETIRKKLYLNAYTDNWQEYEHTVDENFKGLAKQGMRIKLKSKQ